MHGGRLKQWYHLTPRCYIFGVLSFQAGLRAGGHVRPLARVAETARYGSVRQPRLARLPHWTFGDKRG